MSSTPTSLTAPSTSSSLAPEAARIIADLAAKARSPEIIHVMNADDVLGVGLPKSIPVLWNPAQGRAESLAPLIEQHRLRPERKTGTAKALTLASFIDLVNRHKTEHSAVFANSNWEKPGFTAVIDYHDVGGGAAAFGKHRVGYDFPLSEEWKVWVVKNGQSMTQSEFAVFIEDHIAELASPTDAEKAWLERDFATTVADPAKLMTLSRGLQVNVDSVVKNAQTLQTGEASIQFEESHKDSDGKPLKVPGLFMLRIAPFFMGVTVTIPVRLRYRVSSGKIIWMYQMYRPDAHVTERVRDDLATVADKCALPVFEASPEMAGG